MGEDTCLLVTFYVTHPAGDTLACVAVRIPAGVPFDSRYPREHDELIRSRLPPHLASLGPIVSVEPIFYIV